MRSIAKAAMRMLVRSDFGWRVAQATLLPAAEYAKWERVRFRDLEAEEFAAFNRKYSAVISPDLVIRHGPFKGMKYLEHGVTCGPLIPRVLGSYERELHDIIEVICRTKYSEVIDIGCAEGFYAVGLALRVQGAKVYAFDSSERARKLCGQMATANGVADRVTVDGFCSPTTLINFPFSGRGLILSDCEGYERELFTPVVARSLSHCDVLVELHDLIDVTTSCSVMAAFEETHDVVIIESLDDIKKARLYHYPELVGMDLATRKRLVSENRGSAMEWAFFTPKVVS